jgi:ubiquinone/menaquinone biosynthesis C-methylase UbiE
MTIQNLNKELGNIDIYLLDQILKGRYGQNAKILDAGCGEGRNLIYFLNNNYQVFGVDENPDAIRLLHFILGSTYPYLPKSNFQEGTVEKMTFNDENFNLVISSAVLHFAKSQTHFDDMINDMIRVLKPKGHLFIRTASDIGLNEKTAQKEQGSFLLPDGSIRFLITEKMIHDIIERHSLKLVEPIKTTNVNNLRCMTTLVLEKI